jgi:DNA-binding CsgD family transcriptional regulator
LKHLSKELDLSLSHHEDLKEKLDLENKKRELTSKALKSVSEQEFLKKIIKNLSNHQLDNKKIIKICKDRLQSRKGWNVFIKLFNDIHPKFNQYIINKNSNITESELRVCNLIKMSFSSSEIAEILSISIRGVEQHRYRIRKKLKIKSDLTIFIQSI